jgi:hypothetical protein
MQCSVHPPPPFIQAHLDRLLPAWNRPVQSVLVVLQHCNSALWERTLETEVEKDLLRQQFIQLGQQIASQLQQLPHLVEVIDPQTGLPTLSQAGSLKLDVVRVVDACLGYTIAPSGTCKVIVHPTWGSAVYPAVILSSAQPSILQGIVDRLILQDGG